MNVTPIETTAATKRSLAGKLLRNPLAIVPIALLACIVIFSLLAPVFAPYSPTATKLLMVNAPPGAGYLLGGDGAGRDVLSRLVYAGRLTLAGSFFTVLLAVVFGVTTGLVAGYWGGRWDQTFGWISNFLIVLPEKLF